MEWYCTGAAMSHDPEFLRLSALGGCGVGGLTMDSQKGQGPTKPGPSLNAALLPCHLGSIHVLEQLTSGVLAVNVSCPRQLSLD